MQVSRLLRRLVCAGLVVLLWPGGGGAGAAPLRTAVVDSTRQAAPDTSRTVHAMDTVRLPRTKAGSGRRVGIIAGGIAGAVTGTLLGLLIVAISESEGDTEFGSPVEWIVWDSAWTLAGAGSGALLGTIIGSTIPAESRRGERGEAAEAADSVALGPGAPPAEGGGPGAGAPADAARPGRRYGPVGSLTPLVMGGTMPNPSSGRGGFGGRLELQAHRGPGYRLGLQVTRLQTWPRVTSVGLCAAARLAPHWLVRLGLSDDRWSNGLNLLGGDLGLEWSSGDYRAMNSWVVIAGAHGTLQNFDEYGGGETYLSLGAGRRFGW